MLFNRKLLLAALAVVATGSSAYGADHKFNARAVGGQEVVFDATGAFVPGGRDTDAEGRMRARFNAELTEVKIDLRIDGLLGTFAAAHLHCARAGANGPVAFGLVNPGPLEFDGKRIRGTLGNGDFSGGDCSAAVGRPINNIAALYFAMRDGLVYLNVHSSVFPPGEIRGQMRHGAASGHDEDD